MEHFSILNHFFIYIEKIHYVVIYYRQVLVTSFQINIVATYRKSWTINHKVGYTAEGKMITCSLWGQVHGEGEDDCVLFMVEQKTLKMICHY
jgi:hypothetical protein